VGGPEMAPHTPQRSGRPGKAGPPLDSPLGARPEMAPPTPQRSGRPGKAGPPLDSL